jgi:NAD(P)-dependent dehydrogenase (short-subunit alcohol dehydrogenase family)
VERRFDGKTFMVTGAGTGFGAALALRAAREGAAKVVVHYRTSSCRATSPRGRTSNEWRPGRSRMAAASTC